MVHLHYRKGRNGIPILKDADIDIDAENILRDYSPESLKVPQPLDVEDFTEGYLGLNIHYENLSHNGCIWGCMIFNNRKIPVYVPELKRAEYCPIDADTVVIDNSLLDKRNENAFRSTMIHECGHSIYHAHVFRETDGQLSLFSEERKAKMAIAVCRSSDILGNQKRALRTDHDWTEHQAKYFSAAILMPKSMVELIYKDHRSADYGEDMLADCLSGTFKVSRMSASIRIKQLKLESSKESHRTRGFLKLV